MKILILANNDVGLYKFRKELIENLLFEHEVYIALPMGELIEPLKKMGCQYIDANVDRRGINPITDMKLWISYMRMIKKIKPDLIITYTIKPNIYGGFAARILKIPYAMNITGLGTSFERGGLLTCLVTRMYKIACKRAKVVFFENKANRNLFLEKNIIEKNQSCLLNGAGVNLEEYVVTEYPTDDIIRFLFIGRVMKEKGVNELFAAMDKLYTEANNIHLDVIGQYEEDYEGVIEKYEKVGWLTYLGYQKDVRPFINQCHCFVLPSWHEGMANTNLECAASGRPIITSNIAGCREAVIDSVTGYLIEIKNKNSLYATLKKFLQLTYDDKKSMGIEGRKHMIKMFDKKKVVNKTLINLFIARTAEGSHQRHF